ncbi:hypothetical protein E2542_SST13175 [Spatholobus suberectus]|nr:hypothetical protein E2542_SST13175 [Spatholobus suberectus]
MSIGHRRLVQVIPDSMQEWWDKWELRGLILLSLVSLIILTLLGDRRKYKPNILTRPLLWSAYLVADWVAAVAMGVISSNLGDYYNKGEQPKNVNPQLLAFWAPFFLMHLGGPDTITAYALEDNELWLRHFVGLLSQTALTVYVIILSWKGILSFVQLIIQGKVNGKTKRPGLFSRPIYIFVSLFVDLVLSPSVITQDRRQHQDVRYFVWSGLNLELHLMYDVFYTKAFANYGFLGLTSRLITLITTSVVLVIYANLSEKKEHLVMDHIITYLLLVGALIGEIYAVILVAFSQWTTFHFEKKGLSVSEYCIHQACILCWKIVRGISFGQSNFFNLICNKNLNKKSNFFPASKFEELPSVSHCLISNDLQNVIRRHLCDESKAGTQSNPSGAPGYRNLLLEKNVPIFTSELEFHRTIITWHIATDLFYYSDAESSVELAQARKNCKEMSDYMFYLLVKQRHMLPVGAGLLTLCDTVNEAREFFKDVKVVPQPDNLAETSRKLLQHDPATARDEASETPSTSVLFHACAVAKQLIAGENRHLTWKFVEELWIEIMSYAGAQCRVDMHAHQLRRGPEFLSLVWLLQAHLGLLDQFQITPRQTTYAASEPNSPLDARGSPGASNI